MHATLGAFLLLQKSATADWQKPACLGKQLNLRLLHRQIRFNGSPLLRMSVVG